jgi:hypothetical protein
MREVDEESDEEEDIEDYQPKLKRQNSKLGGSVKRRKTNKRNKKKKSKVSKKIKRVNIL